ncbi:hypothetical protein D9619_000200 [Psilocybe cf. subviscida]|uniref:Uncharacterized protein n=1 Tax=Psilocybe cf. subviscida TaxID=2480587 RepID=A0A8H5BE66_9AGAR|nr:hypothetical protein D9619_000200 [Psilocybe cf. subviscida]
MRGSPCSGRSIKTPTGPICPSPTRPGSGTSQTARLRCFGITPRFRRVIALHVNVHHVILIATTTVTTTNSAHSQAPPASSSS